MVVCYRKEGSQETMATMMGMSLGMLLARFTSGNPLAIWFSFLSLTVFHMYGELEMKIKNLDQIRISRIVFFFGKL